MIAAVPAPLIGAFLFVALPVLVAVEELVSRFLDRRAGEAK